MTAHLYSIVMTTTDSDGEADSLARALIEQRLAACVQLTRIVSHYVWDEVPTRSDEILMLVKTRSTKVPAVLEFFDTHHSYDTPESIEIPVTSGLPKYLRWIDDRVT